MGKYLTKEQEFQEQKQQIEAYSKIQLNEFENIEMGYMDMNSRMLDLEKNQSIYADNAAKWKRRKTEHDERKKQIESKWLTSTNEKAQALKSGVQGDDKEKEYYRNFGYEQLEILLKNSNNHGNSDKFNDVATDLELLNRVGENWNVAERYKLLTRLSETCKEYIRTRNPWSREGKRRKAMISALYDKVTLNMQTMMTSINEASQVSTTKLAGIGDELSDENQKILEEACKAKFDLISMHLQGNIELKKEEIDTLDQELTTIMTKLQVYGVDENQSDNIGTRFMNAIGWSQRKPRLQNYHLDISKGQLKIPLYHTIQALSANETAERMINQLKGKGEKNRQFLSDGNFTKGTYTAARNIEFENGDDSNPDYDMEAHDKAASKHSWLFGERDGSMQVKSIFNEKARILDSDQASKLLDEFKKSFSSFSRYLGNENRGNYGNGSIPHAANVIFSLFGYNTFRVKRAANNINSPFPLDYYTTWDRSAFTMEDNVDHIRIDGVPEER